MGSRIMHLIIANKVAEHLSINDRTSFLIGGIAPDAASPKSLSHYFSGDAEDYTRCIDFNKFLSNYRSQKDKSYILGYYTHLIADDIWLTGFYLPWLKNRIEASKDVYQQYHHDFHLLNGKLLEHYQFKKKLMRDLNQVSAIPDLKEVKAKEVEAFIPYVLGDMEYSKDELYDPLKVFTFEQIVGYIETSVERGLYNLNSII
ncbi:zinc dependent phospholipase C family protein [Bacillaceae bacterium W0354]